MNTCSTRVQTYSSHMLCLECYSPLPPPLPLPVAPCAPTHLPTCTCQDPNAKAGKFGFAVDNTIGATPQPNGWMDDWVDFFRERRIKHQLQLLGEPGACVTAVIA